MANETTPVITPIWYSAITSGKDADLPVSGKEISKIAGLSGYCYEEMVKRLNDLDKGKGNDSIGYFLRRLWGKLEGKFSVLESKAYNQWHERDINDSSKANPKPLNKKAEIGFYENGKGGLGVHSDLLYDTYGKKWSRAYQLTFYCFFRQMDYLANPGYGGFSYMHENSNFRFVNGGETSLRKYRFWEIIRKDIEILIGDKEKLNRIHKLSDYEKAPLYDIIGEALGSDFISSVPSCVERKQFSHGHGYWMATKDASFDFPQHLGTGVFAHMASIAIVNQPAFKAMETYLPNSRKMFGEVLDYMVLGLGEYEVNNSSGWETTAKIPHLPPLTIYNPFSGKVPFFNGIKIMDQGFNRNTIDIIKSDIECAEKYVGFRNLVIIMAQHHLHKAQEANGRKEEYYELTYVCPHFCGKHHEYNNFEVYQGYHEGDHKYCRGECKHTMGPAFSRLVKLYNPEIAIHLHPLVDDVENWRRKKPQKTMFSDGDQDYFLWDSLWIGIQPFKESNNKYYVDTYVSRINWGTIEDERYKNHHPDVRGGIIPGMHMERIEGLIPECRNELDIYKATKDDVERCR